MVVVAHPDVFTFPVPHVQIALRLLDDVDADAVAEQLTRRRYDHRDQHEPGLSGGNPFG
jgi:hypothetical protein